MARDHFKWHIFEVVYKIRYKYLFTINKSLIQTKMLSKFLVLLFLVAGKFQISTLKYLYCRMLVTID